MLFSIFDVLRIFEALQILFYRFLLKWGKIEEDFESSIFLESQKYYFAFESRLICFRFSNGHIRNVVSTLPNVVQLNVEIRNVVSTLLNVVDFSQANLVFKSNLVCIDMLYSILTCWLLIFYGVWISFSASTTFL